MRQSRSRKRGGEGRGRGSLARAIALLLLFPACQSDEKAALLQDSTGSSAPDRYLKPEGVALHVPALLGASFSRLMDSEVGAQLGSKLGEERLPGIRGSLHRYENGTLSVARDEVYEVRYDYPTPVDKLEALHRVGLPESVLGELKETSTALRAERSSYGMRRLVIERESPGAERFVRLQAWKFIPQERF